MTDSAIEHRRTRRSGIIDPAAWGFSPRNIEDLSVWLRADSLSSELSDGDSIRYWEDESGNSNHAVQNSASRQFTYKENIINGHSVIRGAGNIGMGIPPLNENLCTYFVVWSRTNAANNDIILGDASTTYAYLQYGALWYVFTSASQSVAMAADIFFLKSCVYDNVNYQRYTNGSAESAEVGSGNARISWIGTQGAGAFNGDVAEVIIYTRNIINAERQKIENYLNTKYALW